MLIVPASQLCHPVLVFVEMESGDGLIHALIVFQKGDWAKRKITFSWRVGALDRTPWPGVDNPDVYTPGW